MNLVARSLVGALRGAIAMALIDGARTIAAGRLARSPSGVERDRLVRRVALGALVGTFAGARGLGRGLAGATLLTGVAELARSRFGYHSEHPERRIGRALGFLAFGLIAGATVRRRFRAIEEAFSPLPGSEEGAWSDRIDEESEQSFPASDPPSFNPGHV